MAGDTSPGTVDGSANAVADDAARLFRTVLANRSALRCVLTYAALAAEDEGETKMYRDALSMLELTTFDDPRDP